jgi:hypothetical protein
MFILKNKFTISLAVVLALITSCKDLDELNINPNGVDPENADLNLLLPTMETGIGQAVVSLGFGDIAGVMQHTQKDGWSGGHNDYDWDNQGGNWSSYYGILRNNDDFYQKAVDGEFEFHQGVSLVLRSYTIGMIADLWGDAPFTEALLAEDGPDYFKPAYDSQKDIYMGIFADLEEANTLLSNAPDSYSNINAAQDLIYEGDVAKWRKFANSLALRYYMRLSVKEPGTAEEGIKRITSDPSKYPLITSAGEDAKIGYIGDSPRDSWPSNTVFDASPTGSYMRVKLCSTLVEALQSLNDPRLGVWANKIETPLVLAPGEGVDEMVDGERRISQDIVDDYEAAWGVGVDYDPEYVGIPPSIFAAPQYNLNPNLEQAVFNPHASQLNDIYKETTGDLLQMRIMSAAEVHFILSEAAVYGWASGTAEAHYAAGIQQSLNAWGVGDSFDDYIGGAPYSGKESIIQQKWIASWTAAAESWFDYRRTGLPDLQTGESAKRQKLPLRFYYNFDDEIALNPENANAAISQLEPTDYKGNDISNNSAWSRTWLLKGTGLPY